MQMAIVSSALALIFFCLWLWQAFKAFEAIEAIKDLRQEYSDHVRDTREERRHIIEISERRLTDRKEIELKYELLRQSLAELTERHEI